MLFDSWVRSQDLPDRRCSFLPFGIGASTAVFSILDSVLLRPYAFRDPGQIVIWREVVQEAAKEYPSVPDNYRHFLYLRAHANTIQEAALLQNASFAVSAGGDHPRIEKGLNVSPNFFSVLGVTPSARSHFPPGRGAAGQEWCGSDQLGCVAGSVSWRPRRCGPHRQH